MKNKGTVLVIGASGMVGYDTVKKLCDYIPNINVLTFDRPVTELSDIEARETRLHNFHILEGKSELLDHAQEQWLLRNQTPLKHKNTHSSVNDIASAIVPDPEDSTLPQDVDTIIITAGAQRKSHEDRSVLLPRNAPIFIKYGQDIADAFVAKLEQNPNARFPVIIVAGNPMDAMTEALGKAMNHRFAQLKKTRPELEERIQKTMNDLPNKIIGQGGILDGARGAFAIHDELKIPLEDIISVPVLGTHNDKMVIDYKNVIVLYNGEEMRLKDYGFAVLNDDLKKRITAATRIGGEDVITDTKERTKEQFPPEGLEQSAVFATAAAILMMAQASLSKQGGVFPAASYDLSSKVLMGKYLHISHDGAKPDAPLDRVNSDIIAAEAGAKGASLKVLTKLQEKRIPKPQI